MKVFFKTMEDDMANGNYPELHFPVKINKREFYKKLRTVIDLIENPVKNIINHLNEYKVI